MLGALFRTAFTIIVGIILGVAGTTAYLSTRSVGGPVPSIPLPPSSPLNQLGPLAGADAATQVYERVSPAVVNITTLQRQRDVFGRGFQQEGTGSGFIIDDQGHVVTNQHVVAGAARLDVTLADGTIYVGELVASDSANDIALVKLQAPPERLRQLTTVPLGDSSALKVGQPVVAIGNPFGLERSASMGIVSSLGRSRPGLESRLISNMIQTDAAINPGNSGGPLLNLRGEVVGINEQIETATGTGRGNVGIGFAIPVNTLKRFLPELLAGQEPRHAYIGIAGAPLTPTLAEQIRVPVQQGVILSSVVPNGPAARGGLRGGTRADPTGGDVITDIDGHTTRSVEDVAAYIDQKNPGETVKVTYLRGGQFQTADVALGVWENRESVGR
jgi:S1-C subfamily serine protease